jgi:DNA topoisomerase I
VGGEPEIAAVQLVGLGPVAEATRAEKNVLAVAERLGNTRDISRSSYIISPRVIDRCLEGSVVAYSRENLEEVIAAEQEGLTEGEKELLKRLNKKLHRELREAT